MEEVKEISPLSLTVRIKKISFLDFKIVELSEDEKKKIDKGKIIFEFNLGIKIDPSNKEITIDLTTKIYSDETKSFYIGEINSSGIFVLENIEEIINQYKGVPTFILSMFAGMLISTTRGFLLLKAIGTPIEDVYIPVVDLSNLIPAPASHPK